MTRSKLRAVISILLLLIICGVAGYDLKSSFWPDNTCEASLIGLQSYWPSSRRTAASSLSQYAGEADKVVPALVRPWVMRSRARRCRPPLMSTSRRPQTRPISAGFAATLPGFKSLLARLYPLFETL